MSEKMKWTIIVLVALSAFGALGAIILERQNRHKACIEALKSVEVGDLARHDICTH